jgi:hypothetical protein
MASDSEVCFIERLLDFQNCVAEKIPKSQFALIFFFSFEFVPELRWDFDFDRRALDL